MSVSVTYRVPFSAAGSLQQDVLTLYSGPSSADGTIFFFPSADYDSR